MNKHHLLSKALLCSAALAGASLLPSCVSPKEVLYIQDVSGYSKEKIQGSYQTLIQKDDQLSITVSSKQPELTAPFAVSEIGTSGPSSSSRSKGYLVDARGYIVLPVIGKIKAAGKTCSALGDDIAAALKNNDYISDASVNVQITNFKFSILGEVSSPGTYNIDGQRLTILEAISRAGDLSIDGNRDVTLIRETVERLLKRSQTLKEYSLQLRELYQTQIDIQQNDTIYVTPAERKINTRSDTVQYIGWTASGVGLIIGIIALCAL